MSERLPSTPAEGRPPRGRLVGLALVSLAVLLLQLLHTRVLSPMLWHHLAYLVVTFTLLGFAAGGALLACRTRWLTGDINRRLTLWALAFGGAILLSYAVVTRTSPTTSWTTAGLLTAAMQYGVLVLPMVFGGMVVALSLSDSQGRIGRVYAWNMGGSAAGCALFVPCLRALGGEGSVLFAAGMACLGAATFGWHARRPVSGLSWTALVLSLALFAASALSPQVLFAVPIGDSKLMVQTMALRPELRIEQTLWDPICRLDIVGPGPEHPDDTRIIYQDGDAPTMLPMGPAERDTNPYNEKGLAYLLFRDTAPRVLAIGIGGGEDILQAKAPRSWPDGSSVRFDGVELNATTMHMMRTTYRERTGDRYALPGVTIHLDEGRSWLRRSDDRFDIIQMTGTDTYTALSSGSYVLSESYLYTAEAFDDYVEHLTPDGVLSMVRFRFEPPRESLRIVAFAVEALKRAGAQEAHRHVLVIGWDGRQVTTPDGQTRSIGYGAILVKRSPFRDDEIARYKEFTDLLPRFTLIHAPGEPTTGTFTDYLGAVAGGTEAAFRDGYRYDLSEVTDDRPFFFRFHRWDDVWRYLRGESGTVSEPESGLARHAENYLDLIGDKPLGLMVLLTALGLSALLLVLLVFAPLMLFRRDGLDVAGGGWWILFFTGLGAGYLLIEIAVIQRFVLFVGHPGYAITAVLVAFLSFSAMGAALVGRSSHPGRMLNRSLAAVLVLLVLLVPALPLLFDAALGLPLPARLALTVAVLAPLAFVMGMPFPAGLALVQAKARALVPWAVGVNGGASVLASVAGILLAMVGGFRAAFLAAALAYLMALCAVRCLAPGDAAE